MGTDSIKATKSKLRVEFIDRLMSALQDPRLANRIYKSEGEFEISLVKPIEDVIHDYIKDTEPNRKDIYKRVDEILVSQKKLDTHVSSANIFGVNHRPDFIINMKDYRVAIELKKGNSGDTLRSAIGQSIVYSVDYDFVCVIYLDDSKVKDIKQAASKDREKDLCNSLWENLNIRFGVL